MKRIISKKDLPGYTLMKQVLINLDLNNKDYIWLISDIEAYPSNKELEKEINEKGYLILSTKELMSILDEEDFQWIWAVFSAIPNKYTKEEILEKGLPYIQSTDSKYNPFEDEPKVQHHLAEFEICAWDSSGMFLVSDDDQLLNKFEKAYPLCENDTDIIFDDWKTRNFDQLKVRRRQLKIYFVIEIFIALFFLITILFDFISIVLFLLSLIFLYLLTLEWLNVNNNHLVIKKDRIIITNKFNKSIIYEVNTSKIKLELKRFCNSKNGAIIMKFYNENNEFICKYDASDYQAYSFDGTETKWLSKIKSLGIEIIDLSEVIKK